MTLKAMFWFKFLSVAVSRGHQWLIIVGFLLVIANFSPQSLAQDGCQESVLPEEVRRLIVSKYPAWRILRLSDLVSDDQQIWVETYPKVCPGIAMGHFRNNNELAYVVTLIRQEQGKQYQLLLIVEKGIGNKYSLRLLNKPTQVSAFSVIIKMPPGTYANYDESRSVLTKLDSIVYAKLESGALMYYWKGNLYRSMQVSI
jgi:hypothetical protein